LQEIPTASKIASAKGRKHIFDDKNMKNKDEKHEKT
jgi:hypothetical protein